MKYKLIMLASLFATHVSLAALPEYNPPEILARANIQGGYNLPSMSFLNNTSPVINNRGDVAFKVMAVEGVNNQALWLKTAIEPNGKIVYVAPDERFLTEPSTISENGKIAFNLYDEGVTDGLFIIDSKTLKVDQVLSPDNLPIQYYTYPQVQNNGHIFFRATDDNSDRMFYEFTGTRLNKIIAEGVESLGIKSSYLFRPSVNEAGSIAFKSRMGERGQWDERSPDSILMLSPSTDPKAPGLKVVTIASDKDSDPRSNFLGFGNTVSLSNHGLIAFMGVQLDSKKSIVLAQNGLLKTVAAEGSNGISEIEMFAPKVNDHGLILFRAKDMEGKRGLYLADDTGVKRVIGEGDDVGSDLGLAKILYNPNYPGIGGDVDMNDQGEIVFYCMIVSSPDNKELGSAVFKITPKR
ncbi:MAG: DUF7453 family protein [Bacteriovorax sp.]